MNIKIDNLFVKLGNKPIIKGLNLSINSGELVGIIGPNGSGKSTLLRTIYRVLKPETGVIYFDGINIQDKSYKETARQLSVVSQHNNFSFDFSVGSVVVMGRAPHKRLMEQNNSDDYRLVREALTRVGLSGFEKRRFNTLSGGEQQRVILARALVQNTETLILDEPTNHLDIKYQLQLMSMVKNIGCTTIAAIHDLNIAVMYCDKIVVIKAGQLMGVGTPDELITPELIWDIYGVNATIYRTKDNEMYILFTKTI
ncbi:ABC transporter ATP-binding protein [uncultured Anaerovibrio sp.]|uniref:ABC transporter ATP-binding protein n=1 Tax=uncultured Anaerovibrio sp. TaxID=361586 RepID=UPI00261B06E6|nr:ABC transporter ATP-binding protein [uncultured Anaerovibrio sp.]